MTDYLSTLDDVILGMIGGPLRAAQDRLAQARQARTKAVTKKWDESQHPREPAGSGDGGQFTEGGGGVGGDGLPNVPPQFDSDNWTSHFTDGIATPPLRAWVNGIANRVGWPGQVNVSPSEGPPFKVGGEDHVTGGQFYGQTDMIQMFLDHASQGRVEMMIAHEATHGLFKYGMRELEGQSQDLSVLAIKHDQEIRDGGREARDLALARGTLHWPYRGIDDDRLTPDMEARFPLSYAYRELIRGPGSKSNVGQSMQDWQHVRDGKKVSPYAASWWNAFLKGKANINQAMNETVAEIGSLWSRNFARQTTPERARAIMREEGVSEPWLKFHEEMMKAGRAGAAAAKIPRFNKAPSDVNVEAVVIGSDGVGEAHLADGSIVFFWKKGDDMTKALAAADLTAGGALVPVEHSKGTVQALLPPTAVDVIREWVLANLDPVDVVELEDSPHVTVRYGFDPEVTTEDVVPLVTPAAPLQLLISGLGIFEGVEGGTRDVLVAWVNEDGALTRLHHTLGMLPNESTHDTYRPHLSIAYVAAGDGEALLDSLTETPHLTVEIDHLEWRGADGTRAPLPLTGGPMPLTDAVGQQTKEWDEGAHPREPEGTPEGGRFTEGGGSGRAGVGNATGASAASDMDPRLSYHVTTVEEAFARLSEGQKIILAKPRMVSTLLDKLAAEAAKAREAGTRFSINLCDVSVAGSNIFCDENVGYSRVQMPQLSGKPLPGSTADALPKNKKGEVDLGRLFADHLEQTLGISVTEETIQAKHLKASQNELDGEKVAGMMRAMELGQIRPAPIFVTSDDYVVDGHHRWAAKLGRDLRSGLDLDAPMPISKIHSTILEVLVQANRFAIRMGIPPAAMRPDKESLKAWWAEQVERLTTKEWDESAHPREPAGGETGGQFTEGGGGGLSPGLTKTFDTYLSAAEGQDVALTGSKADEWDDLGSSAQDKVEENWKQGAFDSELEYQQQSWDENVKPDVIEEQLNNNFDWVKESWDTFAETNTLAQMLNRDSLLAAVESAGKDGLNLVDAGAKSLIWHDDQANLPGMEPPSSEERWAAVRDAWKDDYQQARSDRAEELDNEIETPDLSDDAQESINDNWDQMADNEKFDAAKGYLSPDELGGEGDVSSDTLRIPTKWHPFSSDTESGDHAATRTAALYLASQRTADLMLSGAAAGVTRDDLVESANTIARDVWGAWKEKSGTGLGAALQVAAADVLQMQGIRLPVGSDGSQRTREQIITRADNSLPGGYAGLKAYVQALHETSQYVLAKAGVTEVETFRAIMVAGDVVGKAEQRQVLRDFEAGRASVGTRVNIDLTPNGAASTTLQSGTANGWNGIGKVPPNAVRVVIRSVTPASAVLSLPVYGQNVHGEQEVMVLGTDWKKVDAWLRAAPEFSDRPVTPWNEADHPRDADGKFT